MRSLRWAVPALVLALFGSIAPASAQEDEFWFQATLEGQRLDLSTSSDPVVIEPGEENTLTLELHNPEDRPVVARQVRLRGQAFGVTLVSYDVLIQARVPAESDLTVDVPVDFGELDEQVNGVLPASMALIDTERDELASQGFTMDVRGDGLSMMGLFTLALAIAVGLSVLSLWLGVVRRRLPPSRWRRGLRFGMTGAGTGVLLMLLLAQLRLVAPSGTVWVPIVLIPTAVAFLLGYLSPGPLAIEDEEEGAVEDWMRAPTTSVPSSSDGNGERAPETVHS